MNEKNQVAIERIENEISKIDKKENNIYFFVLDTKGNPSGSLEYIYKLAKILHDKEYNVTMLYQLSQDEDFVGVGEWLGEEYSSLNHADISSNEVSVSPSDVLFIPEIFSNIMIQTKKLPCKRIALLQNYDYILEQMPIASQWGDLGIMEAMTNSDLNASLVKSIFPYVKTYTVNPYIDKIYGETNEPKKLIINIISNNQDDINKIIKPFYWKYPMYKWVSFRDLRGFPKEIYSKYLRESAITIWVDENTSFGYGALEAMKSGSIVIAKNTTLAQEWMETEDGVTLSNCCVWFETFHEVHKIIASVVRAWITDNVPSDISEAVAKSIEKYTYENTSEKLLTYIDGIFDSRKNEMKSLITQIKEKEE